MTLESVGQIDVVDLSPDALATGRERVAQIEDRNTAIICNWLDNLNDAVDHGDLCVIASQARGRVD